MNSAERIDNLLNEASALYGSEDPTAELGVLQKKDEKKYDPIQEKVQNENIKPPAPVVKLPEEE